MFCVGAGVGVGFGIPVGVGAVGEVGDLGPDILLLDLLPEDDFLKEQIERDKLKNSSIVYHF